MKHKNETGCSAVILCIMCLVLTANAQIVIDGGFSDWSSSYLLGIDPAGDVSGGDPVDWVSLWVTAANGSLYLSYETDQAIDFTVNAWRYSVYIDTDNNPLTGFRGSLHIGADYMVEGGLLWQYTGTGQDWSWTSVGALNYAINGTLLEMEIPEANLGLSVGYVIKVLLVGNNPTTQDFARNDLFGYQFPPSSGQIQIDGGFSDWTASDLIGTDPANDVSAGDRVDWLRLWARSDNGNLCLSYEVTGAIDFLNDAWRYGIYLDADNNAATGFRHWDGSWGVGADYLIEGGFLYEYTGSGTDWSWNYIGWVSYAYNAGRLEMSVPESWLGLSGDYNVRLLLLGNNAVTTDYASDNKAGYSFPSSSVEDYSFRLISNIAGSAEDIYLVMDWAGVSPVCGDLESLPVESTPFFMDLLGVTPVDGDLDSLPEDDIIFHSRRETYTTLWRGGTRSVSLYIDTYGNGMNFNGSLELYNRVITNARVVNYDGTGTTVSQLSVSGSVVSWSGYIDGAGGGGWVRIDVTF